MVTRKNAPKTDGVASGYHGEVETDVNVESCNLEDVDKALFNLFDKELDLQIETKKDGIVEIPVIFATGERFAIIKRRKPIRDHNRALILPLISVARTGITQTPQDVTGRGINQSTGDLTIKKQLSTKDRDYQNIINAVSIRNQKNLFVKNSHSSGSVQKRSDRTHMINPASSYPEGALLAQELNSNIYEFITIPQPQFYTAEYTITLYTQYTQHMNELMQKIMNSFLPQGRCFKITTNKGYWFNAFFEDSFESQSNVDDFAENERVIMSSINCKVPAYLIAGSDSGGASPIRKFYSLPQINFEITTNDDEFKLNSTIESIPQKELIEETFNGVLISKVSSNPNVGETIFKKK